MFPESPPSVKFRVQSFSTQIYEGEKGFVIATLPADASDNDPITYSIMEGMYVVVGVVVVIAIFIINFNWHLFREKSVWFSIKH